TSLDRKIRFIGRVRIGDTKVLQIFGVHKRYESMPRSFYIPAVSLRLGFGLLIMGCLSRELGAQQAFTWDQVRDKFESSNPVLRAGEINIEESKAQEITAFLRPNPEGSIFLDQVGNTASGSIFSGSNLITSFSYLHERQHKRELRRDS